MSERSDQQGEREPGKHLLYLVGLILAGLVLYSVGAVVGLELAKRSTEKKAGTSMTTPSSQTTPPVEAASEPDNAQ